MEERPGQIERAETLPLVKLARRLNSPKVDLLCYYATGVNPSKSPAKSLYNRSFDNEQEPDDFFDEGSSVAVAGEIGNADTGNDVLEEDEKEALRKLFENGIRKKNDYAREVINISPSIQRMIGVLEFIGIQSSSQNNPKHYTYSEACIRAQQDMISRYGEQFDQLMVDDPSLKADYQRRLMWYEEQENPLAKKRKDITVEETVNLMEGVVKEETKLLLLDLLKEGAEMFFSLRLGGYKLGKKIKVAKDLFQAIEIDYRNGIEDYETRPLGVFVDGKQMEMRSVRKYSESTYYSPDHLYFMDLFDNLFSKNRVFTAEQIKKYFTILARINLLGSLDYIRNNINSHSIIRKDEKKMPLCKSESKEEIKTAADYLKKVIQNPLRLWSDKFDDEAVIEDELLSRRNVLRFVKWQELMRADGKKPFPSMSFKGEEDRHFLLDLQTALGGALNLFKGTRDSLSHYWQDPRPEVSPLGKVLMDKLNLLIRPDFVITGDPWKHMRRLWEVKELSTYPNLGDLPFRDYQIPEVKKNDQLYIKALKPVSLGKDSDGVIAGRIYAPEFARLATLEVFHGKEKMTLGQDYQIQYEERTGHYRIVFNLSGLEKVKDNPAITYIAGIDGKNLAENAPTMARFLTVPQVDKVLSFSEKLRERGYTAIADNLKKIVEDRIHSHKPITTEDLEQAVKNGAVYAFSLSKEGQGAGKDESSFSYLPNATNSGKAPVQCAHAAMLYAEILNDVFGKGQFHASNMLNTVSAVGFGFGLVFAGAPHVDTRGMVGESRIRHDATPNLSLQSFLSAKGRREKQDVEVQQAEMISKITQEVVKMQFGPAIEKIAKQYVEEMKKFAPKDSRGRLHYPYRIPEAVVEVGKLLHQTESHSAELISDVKEREELIERFEHVRDVWLKAYDLPKYKNGLTEKYRKTFGSYNQNASVVVRSIDEVLLLLKSMDLA